MPGVSPFYIAQMKIILLTGLLLTLITRGCESEANAESELEISTEYGLNTEKTAVLSEWNSFLQKAQLRTAVAETEIAKACDRLDDPNTKNKLLLQSAIFHAENLLERLCEKQDLGRSYICPESIDLEKIQTMKDFKKDYEVLEAHLDGAIQKFHSQTFKK